MRKHIAIIGAGFGGLSTAKLLSDLEYDVTIFEKDSEVGGVWTSSRRYPGLGTQNPGSTYHLSEHPMPKHYPEWPTGEQMQDYIESYSDRFNLKRLVRFNTEVLNADIDANSSKWTIQSVPSKGDDKQLTEESFDFVVVANGIFSKPKVPEFKGSESWENNGGKIVHSSDFVDLESARGKKVMVIGYGKSSCDAAMSIVDVAASTHVVARNIIWKIPKKIGGLVNFKHLLLTRLGEGLFPYVNIKGFDKFLHGIGTPFRKALLGSMGAIISRQLKMKKIGLLPNKPIESIANSSISLASDGFFEAVGKGNIQVHRETQIDYLEPGVAVLKNGDRVEVDLIVAGTGFHQTIPFFEPSLLSRITEKNGDFRLYKNVLPLDVPNLAFVGYNSSLMCQLSCEVGAMMVSEYLRGGLKLPSTDGLNQYIDQHLEWNRSRTDGNYFRGTYVVPFSIHQIDEVLDELDLSLNPMQKFKQWMFSIDPSVYAGCYEILRKRNESRMSSQLSRVDSVVRTANTDINTADTKESCKIKVS
jgi:dimethylaniline monooxygenase (N-oxide forming)